MLRPNCNTNKLGDAFFFFSFLSFYFYPLLLNVILLFFISVCVFWKLDTYHEMQFFLLYVFPLTRGEGRERYIYRLCEIENESLRGRQRTDVASA